MKIGKMRTTPVSVRIILTVVVIFSLVLIGSFSMRYNEMQKQTEALSKQVLAAEQENERLKKELAAPFDEAYVRRVARRALGYCMPGEVIYFSDLDE